MKSKLTIDGLKDLDKALGELPKATARNVLKRTLIIAGQPIADAASARAPRRSGELADNIVVSAKVKNSAGKAEYSDAMRAGLGKDAARSAMRDARRASAGAKSFAEAYVGPAKAKTRKDAIKRIVQEFGSVNQPGQPYMRPAWDEKKGAALDIIEKELSNQISKAAKRLAKKQARSSKG